ncbi:MAG: phenylalanine--tRNA ligase subunit beta [Saprospiraceae bacterium]|nr:phenylalanine--tRNA ligase subunit beta [Saprospiraceae bacterium]
MRISLNWLRELTGIHKLPHEIADILTSLGLEVEGMEEMKAGAVDLNKVMTGVVLTCQPIPDTDHLSATTVDVGDGVARSIVCGAPNVAAGQKVLVALPGAQVFSKDGALFTIGERKVRGIPSQGMICAEDELGIGHDHSGIMVLPDDTPLGMSADRYLNLPSDTIIEIGLTPNRADATHHLGVARDLMAWVRTHENPDARLQLPQTGDLNLPAAPVAGAVTAVQVENETACLRYAGLSITGLTVTESPEWLQRRLLALGQRPINNVVDVTNFVRLEMGQPLHAFDLERIGGATIRVKTLPEGTLFTTLDDTERKLSSEDLMICDGDSRPLCMAGVFGGAGSGVTTETTAVFIESAVFHPRWIRRSMLRHNLRTDAAWTFEKGVDPAATLRALERAAGLILALAGGAVASPVFDHYPAPEKTQQIPLSFDYVRNLIGEHLSADTILGILRALELQVENATESGCTVVAPANKPDVTRPADLVEEILRVYGLDRVPMPTRGRSSMEVAERPSPESLRRAAADLLANAGFFECMNLSLNNADWYAGPDALFPLPENLLVRVHNTANQGLDCMRPTLLFGGLETIRHNQNRQNPDLRLFEFGRTFRRSETGFDENERLAIWITGAHQAESWQPSAKTSADFFTLKASVQNLLARLGLSGFQETPFDESPFRYALRYHRGQQSLVDMGAVHLSVLKKMDIRQPVFYADLDFGALVQAVRKNQTKFQPLSPFPVVQRDLALVLDKQVNFADIRQLAGKTLKTGLTEVQLFDVFEDDDKLGAGKKSYAVRFTFEDKEKTLQSKDIDAAMQQLQTAFQNKLQAQVRQ